jgi:hypothetical protein
MVIAAKPTPDIFKTLRLDTFISQVLYQKKMTKTSFNNKKNRQN